MTHTKQALYHINCTCGIAHQRVDLTIRKSTDGLKTFEAWPVIRISPSASISMFFTKGISAGLGCSSSD